MLTWQYKVFWVLFFFVFHQIFSDRGGSLGTAPLSWHQWHHLLSHRCSPPVLDPLFLYTRTGEFSLMKSTIIKQPLENIHDCKGRSSFFRLISLRLSIPPTPHPNKSLSVSTNSTCHWPYLFVFSSEKCHNLGWFLTVWYGQKGMHYSYFNSHFRLDRGVNLIIPFDSWLCGLFFVGLLLLVVFVFVFSDLQLLSSSLILSVLCPLCVYKLLFCSSFPDMPPAPVTHLTNIHFPRFAVNFLRIYFIIPLLFLSESPLKMELLFGAFIA